MKRLTLLLWMMLLILGISGSMGFADAPATHVSQKRIERISFYKADLAAVLQQIAAECGYNVIISPEITGVVTLQMTDVTYDQALKLIIQGQGLTYHQQDRDIIITKPGQLSIGEKLIAYFPLRYADPIKTAEAIQRLTGVQEISADTRTRTVMVSCSSDTMQRVRQVIGYLDRKMPQITMEVKVVEISSSALRELGAEWQIDDSYLDWGMASSGAELVVQMLKGGHSWGVLFKNLATKGKARLVSAPSVSAVDGEEAAILIGEKVPYETKDKDGNITITYLDVGIKLIFTPRVQNGDEVFFDLKTQVNSLGEKLGNTYLIGAREVNSKIQARIGETVFLGGLITQEERETLSKVPGLGDLFLIGKLFQRKEKSKEDTELIITITPKWNEAVTVNASGAQVVTEP